MLLKIFQVTVSDFNVQKLNVPKNYLFSLIKIRKHRESLASNLNKCLFFLYGENKKKVKIPREISEHDISGIFISYGNEILKKPKNHT